MPRAPRTPRAMRRTPARSRPRSLTAMPTLLGAGALRAAGLRAGAFLVLDVGRLAPRRDEEVRDREALDGRVREEEATVPPTLTAAPGATRDGSGQGPSGAVARCWSRFAPPWPTERRGGGAAEAALRTVRRQRPWAAGAARAATRDGAVSRWRRRRGRGSGTHSPRGSHPPGSVGRRSGRTVGGPGPGGSLRHIPRSGDHNPCRTAADPGQITFERAPIGMRRSSSIWRSSSGERPRVVR